MAGRKRAKKRPILSVARDKLLTLLKRSNPRRIFVGKFSSDKTKIIQTARNTPRRRQKVSNRQRVVVAKRKRIASAVVSAVKLSFLLAASMMLTVNIVRYMRSSPRFSISHIGVGGNTHLTAREIIEQAGFAEGRNIFTVSLHDSAASVQQIPRIRSAVVQRRLPGEIYIDVTERNPLALVLADTLFYVDEEGRVLSRLDFSERAPLTVITGKDLPGIDAGHYLEGEDIKNALTLAKTLKEMNLSETLSISEINIGDPQNIFLVAEQSGATVVLGTGDLRGKLWRLAKVAEAITQNKTMDISDLKRVDLRFEAIVPAQFGKAKS